jgi:hypothetical protein
MAHVQFETILPFLDGNRRLGRLIITFLFCAECALREPLLYLSHYFKQHRQKYYDLHGRLGSVVALLPDRRGRNRQSSRANRESPDETRRRRRPTHSNH